MQMKGGTVQEWIIFNRLIVVQLQVSIISSKCMMNKRQTIPKGQSKQDNPEKPVTQGTQNEGKQNKNTISIGHHYAQINTQKIRHVIGR